MKKISLLLLSLGLFFSASATAKPKSGDRYGDWVYQCAKQNEKSPEVCHISQNLTYKKDNKPLLNIAIGELVGSNAATGKGKEVVVAVLRLGILLTAGVELKIGEGKGTLPPIQWCLANGCHSYVELTTELLSLMKKGNTLNVTFQNPKQQKVTIPVSLKGFTKAYNTLKFLRKN